MLTENRNDKTDVNRLLHAAATGTRETINKPGKTAKSIRNKDSWNIRIQRQIGNWRKELSILAESGTHSDSIKQNIKKRKMFQKYNVTNARKIAQLMKY
jgi:hypothetical protein